jgi:hypothetical protein
MDVFIFPSLSCDSTDAVLVSYTSPATYTFEASDLGETLFFGCDISQRCENGQYVIVTVTEGTSTGNSATPAFAESEINADQQVSGDSSASSVPVMYSFVDTASLLFASVLYFIA